jgi:hypothetical protein
MSASSDIPLDAGEEPPMRQVGDDCERQDELRVADQPKSEKGRAAHTALGVVEESVDTSVCQLGRNRLDEEEVRV